MVVGPRELDLAGHGGRREEEEGGEAARRRDSGGTYRPESTWARGVASGGGWFGPGRLDGERAERAGGAAHGGAAWQLGTRARPGGAGGVPRVYLAADAPWTRSTGGVRRAAGETEQAGRREMEVRAYLRFLKVQGPLGKLKIFPT